MLVTYDGPDDEVTLAPAIGGHRLERGQPVDLPPDVARSLLDQPGFSKVEGKAAKAKPGDD